MLPLNKSRTGRTARQNFMLKRHCINPRCYICGKVTVFDIALTREYMNHRKELPDDFATIDHVYPKNDLRRRLIGDKAYTELCCYKCNHARSIVDYKAILSDRSYVNLVSILKTGNVIECFYPNKLVMKASHNII